MDARGLTPPRKGKALHARQRSSPARTSPPPPRSTRTGASGGPTTRSARSTTRAGGHRCGGAAGEEGQGHLARAQLRREGPAGREEQLSGARPHQPAARHAAHRHRRLLRRARQARHPRRRRHGGDAAAVRHAVGRPRPRVLREPHVERLRLPRGDLERRAEVRHREDQGQDGRPRRVPRRGACARQGLPRGRLRHHLRRPRPDGEEAERRVEAGRLHRRPHRPAGEVPRRGSWDGYPGGDAPGMAFETLEWVQRTQLAALATDTWGAEVRPNETEPGINQPWHWITIPIMGMTMGEIFNVKELAEDCAADGVYEYLFVAPALPITGAVGSPVNPLAIK